MLAKIGKLLKCGYGPDEALKRQIELYRGMTGEQRLKIAQSRYKFACDIARAGIRHQFPNANIEEIELELRRRIEMGWQLGISPSHDLLPVN